MKDLSLIGYGAMGRTVHQALRDHPYARVRHVLETLERADDLRNELDADIDVVTSLDALRALPTLALECAGHAAVTTFAVDLPARAIDTVIASVGALSESDLPEPGGSRVGGVQLVLLPGAIAGIDALRAARLRPLDSVRYTGRKPPRGWIGTPAEARVDLGSIVEATVIFEGNAREAARCPRIRRHRR